jgi:S-adenosylmethionine:tRNA ribosyltransferase-isomerase
MRLSGFDYDLPRELIAQVPVRPRDKCRLMHVGRKDGKINDLVFADLSHLLRKGDVIVLNDSRVIPARLKLPDYGKKAELFLIRNVGDGKWLAMGKPGKMLKVGATVRVNGCLSFLVESINEFGQRIVRFNIKGKALDAEIQKAGSTPLPPYISGGLGNPKVDYQTVYAKRKGSVAAPTAGLHFTRALLRKLAKKGVKIVRVTLHVGPGTFAPVKVDDIRLHRMHGEKFNIGLTAVKALNDAVKGHKRIIAVGTTSVRVLESAFDPKKGFTKMSGETSIFIYPGYRWKCVSGLITNFHLPKSTLIMLVCAFAGTGLTLEAYGKAIKDKYRFYSYGDAMYIE